MIKTKAIKKNKYFLSGLRFGVTAGIFAILAFVLLYLLGENPIITNKYLDFLLITLFLFAAVKELRDIRNNKELHFWEGMTTGFFTYMIAAIISASFTWVFLEIDGQLLGDYKNHSIQLMQGKKDAVIKQMGEQTYQKGLRDVENIQPFDLALDDFLRKILIGFGINVIISIAMRQFPVKSRSQ